MKINHNILSNLSFFDSLLKERKIINDSEIYLEEKGNNSRWIQGASRTSIDALTDNIVFTIKINKVVNKYGIMLRCKDLCNEPYLRFDSDGAAHVNCDENIPLLDRQILTPHFNTFDEQGREFAYHNSILKDSKEAEAIKDNVDFGINLFCNESNSFLANRDIPTHIDLTTLPNLEIEIDFIQNNIKFD